MRAPWLLLLCLCVGCGTRTIADDPFAFGETPDGGALLDGGKLPADGALPSDDGSVIGEDGGILIDPPADAALARIACGTSSCDPTSQECCLTGGGGGPGGGSAACTAKGACRASGGVALPCTGAANCPAGQVCCVSGGGPGASPTAQCTATCTGRGSQTLCASDAECPSGNRCQSTPLGFGFCRRG